MSSRPQTTVLMPASRAFIGFSLGLAFILNLLPWGEALWAPDFVALVLVFWCVRQPRMVGIGVGFLLGLLMDVHNGALLGEHALAYSLLAYGAIAMHRRVPWFGLPGRMLHVLPLLLAAQACVVLIRMAVGAEFPGWVFFASSVVGIALWPVLEWVLLAPQRRAGERDETRPL